jgi:enamine deaminase RidA (YjgF/YER057c/UK114 family)
MNQAVRRLHELGITLAHTAAPVANYAAFTRAGALALLFVSGQLPFGPDGKISPRHTGKLGPESPIDAASEAARLCAVNLIAQARSAIGDLDKVAQVVRLGAFFNVEGRFDALSQAMNGASDLMAAAFAERGRHARTVVGVAHLPFNVLVEIEATFEIGA